MKTKGENDEKGIRESAKKLEEGHCDGGGPFCGVFAAAGGRSLKYPRQSLIV